MKFALGKPVEKEIEDSPEVWEDDFSTDIEMDNKPKMGFMFQVKDQWVELHISFKWDAVRKRIARFLWMASSVIYFRTRRRN